MKGKVYLVGAGPGDPELLTVKASRLLRTAEAVLYDDLVSSEILQLIPPTAQRYSVGKRAGAKRIKQQEINFLMIGLADSGVNVIRLKSGDPLIFGRAGEEIEALRRANIPYEIVPGVTSAFGAASSAQIPLTDRNVSSSVVFITAHQCAERDTADWSKLAVKDSTLVIYMPGRNYTELSEKLRAAGLAAETPCAIVSRATTPDQRTHVARIGDLASSPQLASPVLLIVGKVVRFAGQEALTKNFDIPTAADDAAHEETLA